MIRGTDFGLCVWLDRAPGSSPKAGVRVLVRQVSANRSRGDRPQYNQGYAVGGATYEPR